MSNSRHPRIFFSFGSVHVTKCGRALSSCSYQSAINCYGEFQKSFKKLPPHIELVEGIQNNLYELIRGHDNSFIIIDDLMLNCSNDQYVANLFTRGISVFYLTQNMFPPEKLSRTISLNCHHKIVFRNARDSFSVSTLARQMYPKQQGFLMKPITMLQLNRAVIYGSIVIC